MEGGQTQTGKIYSSESPQFGESTQEARRMTSYLDQNALIGLGKKAADPTFSARLRKSVELGRAAVVASPWHWVETSRTRNLASATRLADFLDSLSPLWLLDRRDLQRIEVHSDFFAFARIDYRPPDRLTTRSGLVARINGRDDAPEFNLPSREFVERMINNPKLLAHVETGYQANAQAVARVRDALRSGKITQEIRDEATCKHIEELLPSRTPQGLDVGAELRSEYLKRANAYKLPTFAVEQAIAEEMWKGQGQTDWNTMIDRFHLIAALPHMDEVVSDDKYFATMYPIAQKTGHVRAKLVGDEEFMKRFA